MLLFSQIDLRLLTGALYIITNDKSDGTALCTQVCTSSINIWILVCSYTKKDEGPVGIFLFIFAVTKKLNTV